MYTATSASKKKPETASPAVAELLNGLIEKAAGNDVSDIHIEPAESFIRVRFRRDGALSEAMKINRSAYQALTNRIKVLVGLDIGESRLPQDGKAHLRTGGAELDIRVSTMPSVFGEKSVIRILRAESVKVRLEDLGMGSGELDDYRRAISRPQGLILITGPTGSGKTTTLYASLNEINFDDRNIMTIEDPVEYQLPGITQVQVNMKSGLTFSKGLRSMLRQDPDVLMVGEIRDAETARIAVQASLTGHLVFSTLHTRSAAGAVERLVDMGIERYLVASSLLCLVAQRLYKEKGETPGRKGLFEFIHVNESIRDLIASGAGRHQIGSASGSRTLQEKGKELVKEGKMSEEELMKRILED